MCEAMRTLMKDEIIKAQEDGKQEDGKQEGRKAKRKVFWMHFFGLVKDGILSIADAAKRANMNAADFEKAYRAFLL